MPKKLILLRHAEAEVSSLTEKDITRPLSARGLEVAGRMAVKMKALGAAPGLVLCSSATRTHQTAQIFMKVLQTAPECLHLDEQLYNAYPDTLEAKLSKLADAGNVSEVLLIAHNPGISHLAFQLSRYHSRNVLRTLTPAGFAMFEINVDKWKDLSEEACRLRHFELP